MFDPVTNAAIKKEIQETKQKNIEQETPVEKGNVEDSRDRKFVFGLDNLLTERAIYTKFLLKKSLVKQVYELGAPVVVRRASKLLPKPDDRQTITSLMESVKDKIESNVEEEREASDTVPNYFESTDGKLFLKGDKVFLELICRR